MTRLVVGITGATGVIYGIRLLELLRGHADVESHLILSAPGADDGAVGAKSKSGN